jgi:hypothetical protein
LLINRYSQAWWYTPIISALGRLRKEDQEFEVILSYKRRPYFKKEKFRKKRNK